MNPFKTMLALAAGLMLLMPLRGQHTLEARAASCTEEVDYLGMNLRDISFFDQNGYTVAWPSDTAMTPIMAHAREGHFTDADAQSLSLLMHQRVYNPNHYQAGLQRLSQALPLADSALQLMRRFESWGFVMFDSYTVLLTLYGPGGSYDNHTGQIVMLATPTGGFKGYANPANTLIHELFHIGIEEPVVRKYGLSHQQKERLVDLFVKVWFGEVLPEYRLQGFGDSRLDPYFTTRSDFENLPRQMELFKKELQSSTQKTDSTDKMF